MTQTRVSGSPELMATSYPRLAGARQPRLTSPVAQGHDTAPTHGQQQGVSSMDMQTQCGRSRKHGRQRRGSSSPAGSALPRALVGGKLRHGAVEVTQLRLCSTSVAEGSWHLNPSVLHSIGCWGFEMEPSVMPPARPVDTPPYSPSAPCSGRVLSPARFGPNPTSRGWPGPSPNPGST